MSEEKRALQLNRPPAEGPNIYDAPPSTPEPSLVGITASKFELLESTQDPEPTVDTSGWRPMTRNRLMLPWMVAGGVLAVMLLIFVLILSSKQTDLNSTRTELQHLKTKTFIEPEELASLKNGQRQLERERAKLKKELKRREKAIGELELTKESLARTLAKQIKKGDVSIKSARGDLVLDLVDKVLFPSGKAELNEEGKAILKRVGDTFRKIPDKLIEVAGHTDNVPITNKDLAEKIPSNWELSSARATNVVRFLHEQCKIPGNRLVASGYGQFRPAASNRSSAGRRRNRRIEVILRAAPEK